MLLHTILVSLALLWVQTVADEIVYGHENGDYNFVDNGDFQTGLTGWTVKGSNVATVSAAAKYNGLYGVHISGRTESKAGRDEGLYQKVDFGKTNRAGQTLGLDQEWYLSCHIKFLTKPRQWNWPFGYIVAKLFYSYYYPGKNTKPKHGVAAKLNFQMPDDWNQIGGDIWGPKSKKGEPLYMEFHVRVEPPYIDYYFDTCALTIIETLGSNWRTILNDRIKLVRTRMVKIRTYLPRRVNPSTARIKVIPDGHNFGWGPGLAGESVAGNGKNQMAIKKFLKDHHMSQVTFNNALKWRMMEGKQGAMNANLVSKSMAWLKANGIKTRGHALLWEVMDTNPDWVKQLTHRPLKNAMLKRMRDALSIWKGDHMEWDAFNEHLNNHFYESRTNQTDISLMVDCLNEAHRADPGVILCISDYRLLRSGVMTSAAASLVKKLQARNAPVGCIGPQAHMRSFELDNFSLGRIMKRLQILSQPGLPLTLTELTVHANETYRAEILEKILYAVYSYPLTHGIIFWGTHETMKGITFEHDTGLYKNDDFTPNAAGQVLERLKEKEWVTPEQQYTLRGYYHWWRTRFFQGFYKVQLWVGSKLELERRIEVTPSKRQKLVVMRLR